MNTELSNVMLEAEGRYLTSTEISRVMDIFRGCEDRLIIMKRLEEFEDKIVRDTVEQVFERFPEFPATRLQAYDKCRRDISLVIRYAAHAMINSNPNLFTEKILYWMKSIVQAQNFVDVAKFTYSTVQTNMTRALGAADAAEINSYMQMMVDVFDE